MAKQMKLSIKTDRTKLRNGLIDLHWLDRNLLVIESRLKCAEAKVFQTFDLWKQDDQKFLSFTSHLKNCYWLRIRKEFFASRLNSSIQIESKNWWYKFGKLGGKELNFVPLQVAW